MPLEKTRLEVFVEGNPALEFVYRGIKTLEVAGVRCAWCDKSFDSVDMSDGRLFTMIHEHVTKSNFHDHLRRHGGGLLALYNRETGPAPATGGFESDLTALCYGLHVQEIIIGGKSACNRFARDGKVPGPQLGAKQLPGERPRESAET